MKRTSIKITVECEIEWDPADYVKGVTVKGVRRSFLRDLRYELTEGVMGWCTRKVKVREY